MTRVAYAVRPLLAWTVAAVSVVAWVMVVRTPMPGRFLFAVLAVGATVEAVRALLLRPTLSADEHGIEVVTGFRRERHPWSAVEHVSTLGPPTERRALRSGLNALEIDLGERLIVVPAYRLGASGDDVAAALAPMRSR